MTHILIISLGNSPEPVINCINSLRPERTVFVCSDGTRQLIDVVRQKVRLPDFDSNQDVLLLRQRMSRKSDEGATNELDQLDLVYSRARDLIRKLRDEDPACCLTLDYTGGTKTMAAGLAMAAVDDGRIQLSLTTHERVKNQASISGYSAPVPVSMAAIQTLRLLDQDLPHLLSRYDYIAAEQLVQRIALLPGQDAETSTVLRRLRDLFVVLDAWDRFDHLRALEVLLGLQERNLDQKLLFPLKRVIGSRRLLDTQAEEQNWPQMRGHGLEAVQDLLHNAERRASQDRFDDAVGRVYRALELAAQLSLKIKFGIDTGALNISLLPDDLREVYTKKQQRMGDEPLKLALMASYDLLAELEHPVGLLWANKRSALMSSLHLRNESLFAHGFQSIDFGSWNLFREEVVGFLESVIQLFQEDSRPSEIFQLPSRLDQIVNIDLLKS
jgi:CRISPR-associated protein (TIGR02710 family)